MQKDLLLDIQRKVIGGYINAEEFGNMELLEFDLDEALFDLTIHKAVARASKVLKEKNIPITEFTILDFLQSHKLPNGVSQEAEYAHLMTEHAITTNSFKTYLEMILKHKMES